MPGIGVVASAVLVFAAANLLAALAAAASYPTARRSMQGLPPSTQAGLLTALACAPAFVGLACVTFALWPSLSHMIGWGVDHCHVHGHHAHFCAAHAPWWTGGALEWVVLTCVGLAAVWIMTGAWIRFRRARRVERALRSARVADSPSRPYFVVDSRLHLALTIGLIHPRIYFSSHLLEALSPAERDVVLNHEQAHRRRRDTLSLLVGDLLSRLHIPWIGRRMLADLCLATERACDEEAALASGDRLGVAETILKVARLGEKRPMRNDSMFATMTGADVQARVHALLQPVPAPNPWPQRLVAVAGGFIAALGWLYAEHLHHAVESALHLLTD